MPIKTIGVIGLGSGGLRHAINLMKEGYSVLCYDPRIPPDSRMQTVMWTTDRANIFKCDVVVITENF